MIIDRCNKKTCKLILLSLVSGLFIVVSCSSPKQDEPKTPNQEVEFSPVIPDNEKEVDDLVYHAKASVWTHQGERFSGYAVKTDTDGVMKERLSIFDGKKQGVSTLYYPDGSTKQVAHYSRGRLHGEKKTWSAAPTHTLLSHLNFKAGKAHGQQKKWYATGEVFKILNYNMGQEEGMQKAYRKNGVLYANYEAKNGRTFGLKKSALCFTLDDEKVQYAK